MAMAAEAGRIRTKLCCPESEHPETRQDGCRELQVYLSVQEREF